MIPILAVILATVTGNPPPAVYACANTTSFVIPFPYLAASHVVAQQTTGGVTSTVTGTVKPSIAPTNGTLTLSSACPSGSTLTISRNVPLTQPQSFRTGAYSGSVHEQALDRTEMQVQQNAATHATDKAAQATKDAAQDAATANVSTSVAALNSSSQAVTSTSSVLAFGSTVPRTLTTRFADIVNVKDFSGASVGAQIDAACASLAGARGTVLIPASVGAGVSILGVTDNCEIRDQRGLGMTSGFSSAYTRGEELFSRYTTSLTGHIQPLTLEIDAYSGGVNSFPGGAATKTQYAMLSGYGIFRTVGERKLVTNIQRCLGKGDCISYFGNVFDFGGWHTGGDEGAEGARLAVLQGMGDGTSYPNGTVASISGSVLTGTWASGTRAYLGEARPVINTSRAVYSTGTVASTSAGTPCTITGSGTSWSTLGTGAHGDLFLEITGNSNGALLWVVPVTSITDDTHLVVEYTVAEAGAGCLGVGMTTSGAYKIYHGALASSLGAPDTSVADSSTVNLAVPGTMFVAGDSIQQPLGYNWRPIGVNIRMARYIGESQGVGVNISNDGPTGHTFESGIRIDNNFQYAIRVGTGVGTPATEVLRITGPVGTIANIIDTTAASVGLFNLLSSGGSARQFLYDRTNDRFQWSGSQYFSGSDSRVSFGTTPQTNVAQYLFYNNAAWSGLVVAANATPSAGVPLLDTTVSGVPRFRVENTRSMVNNGSNLVFFSGNQTGQTASIAAASGAVTLGSVTFANIGTTPPQTNFTMIGCSDCVIANPCAGGGTGAIAKRLAGVWVCN